MYAPPATIRDLWPTPQLGDWAVRDLNRPIPVAGGDGIRLPEDNLPDNIKPDPHPNTGIGEPVDATTPQGSIGFQAGRGVSDHGSYSEQTYNQRVSHHMTHSLGRETLYNWSDAQFNVGGVTYPLDYGFGPGYHGDATVEMGNVQIYMRPGIWQRPKPTV